MPFDKIPRTRRTKTVAEEAAGEDEVDACAVRFSAVNKKSVIIARHPDDIGLQELVEDSEADKVDSGEFPCDAVVKLEADRYTLRQSQHVQIENEDLSKQFVEKKPYDATLPAQGSEAKAEEKAYKYTYCEMFWSVVAIGSYIVDIGSDVFVSYMYFIEQHWWWFGLTMGFAVTSSLTITVASLTWYKQDELSGREKVEVSRAECIRRIVLHVLQLGPVVRYSDAIRYGLRSRRADKSKSAEDREVREYWLKEKADEDTDATLLRLFECYLEAAPQLTLQLYIIMNPNHGLSKTIYFAVGQIVCCVSSLTSIAWALTSYHAALRYSLDNKSNMSSRAVIIMFMWRLCSVTARVLAFALFASYFRFWIAVVIAFHVAMVFLWVQSQQTAFCLSRASEVLFRMVVALLNTFDYFNLTEGHTRLRYLLFYILIFVENLAMTLAIFLVPSQITTPFYLHPVMISILALHLIAIAIQVAYYLRFHPNNDWKGGTKRIQRCLPCMDLLDECCSRPEQVDGKIVENGKS